VGVICRVALDGQAAGGTRMAATAGTVAGEENHTLTKGETPRHTHDRGNFAVTNGGSHGHTFGMTMVGNNNPNGPADASHALCAWQGGVSVQTAGDLRGVDQQRSAYASFGRVLGRDRQRVGETAWPGRRTRTFPRRSGVRGWWRTKCGDSSLRSGASCSPTSSCRLSAICGSSRRRLRALAFRSQCSGSSTATALPVSRATYKRLFDRIGTAYGVGDGSTTFNLPDFRGRFLVGATDGAAGTVISGLVRGGVLGAEAIALGKANIPVHTHAAGTLSVNSSGGHSHGQNFVVNTSVRRSRTTLGIGAATARAR
jgi:microcystin-dependent protein